MSYIEPGISVSDEERAVVEKYGFEVRVVNGVVDVLDPLLQKQKKKCHYKGGTLNTLLREAVVAYRVATASASDIVELAMRKSANPKVEVSPADETGTVEPGPVAVNIPPTAKPAKAPRVLPSVAQPVTNTGRVQLREKAPAREIVADELDNTGKREKPSKREILKKDRKPSLPKKASVIILENPEISKELLARKAGCSVAAAYYAMSYWNEITKVLTEKGWLKIPT